MGFVVYKIRVLIKEVKL
ncbi:unnamed protein product [Gulo gulo]|uniref:Uncharacterized protein n=1 Tax=Gulo gulo TaxID=48420 RepID=A0A9X9LDW7_GULGU|nr:unnamed protein product [Gulo gulo]